MTILQVLVGFFGILIAAVCAVGTFAPDKIAGTVKTVVQQTWAVYAATGVRLVLGILFLAAADATRAPMLFIWFGWLIVIIALTIPILGQARLEKIANWFLDKGTGFRRVWMAFGIAFGLAIVYGSGIG